jgi:S-formylglutathione hydrolase FrmB/lysophospholipase L1-like esterase
VTVYEIRRRPDYRRILVAGDSFMVEGFGPVLERELREVPELEVKRVFRSATGLCRPDYFDWFTFMDELLRENEPELVIISLGANDTQDIVTDDRVRHLVGSDSWNEVYAERVGRILDMAGDAGATVFWVGLPVMGKKLYNQRVSNLNAVVARTCAETLNCRFFDSWSLLADAEGNFMAYVTTPEGKHERIRTKDSIHLTESGAEIMVAAFLEAAGAWGVFGLPGAGPAPEAGEPAGGAGAAAASGPGDPAGPPGAGAAAGPGGPAAAGGLTPRTAGAGGGGAAPSARASARAHDPLAAFLPPAGRPVGSYPAEAVSPPTLLEVNLPSRARSRETNYLLYIPGPEDAARPTVVLLHGPDEGYTVWRERLGSGLLELAQKLGVNLVMPDGDPFGWYLDSPVKRNSRLETYIMKELLPDAGGRFRIDPDRVGLLGVSMGGHGALTLSLKHPGLFRSVGSVSGITVLESHPRDPEGGPPLRVESVLGPYQSRGRLWRENSAYQLTRRAPSPLAGTALSLSVGSADPVALAENRQYHRLLNDLSIPHEYLEDAGAGHDWDLWSREVPRQLASIAGSL